MNNNENRLNHVKMELTHNPIIRLCYLKFLPRLDFGSLDSKSKVLTITPQNQLLINSADQIPAQVSNFKLALHVRGRLRSLRILF